MRVAAAFEEALRQRHDRRLTGQASRTVSVRRLVAEAGRARQDIFLLEYVIGRVLEEDPAEVRLRAEVSARHTEVGDRVVPFGGVDRIVTPVADESDARNTDAHGARVQRNRSLVEVRREIAGLYTTIAETVQQSYRLAYALLQLCGSFESLGSERGHVTSVVVERTDSPFEVREIEKARRIEGQEYALLKIAQAGLENNRLVFSAKVQSGYIERNARTASRLALRRSSLRGIDSRTNFHPKAVLEGITLRLFHFEEQVLALGGPLGVLHAHVNLVEYSQVVKVLLAFEHGFLIERIARVDGNVAGHN